MNFVQLYEEWFFINGEVTTCRVFEWWFETLTKGFTEKKKEKLAHNIMVKCKPTKIKGKVFYYEERDVKTGEVKKQKH